MKVKQTPFEKYAHLKQFIEVQSVECILLQYVQDLVVIWESFTFYLQVHTFTDKNFRYAFYKLKRLMQPVSLARSGNTRYPHTSSSFHLYKNWHEIILGGYVDMTEDVKRGRGLTAVTAVPVQSWATLS